MGAVKIPCASWRGRPMGPPAPRLGGRRPRRRLCFPPPAEECPGPAFIFLLVPGLDRRPVCLVFPCGRHAQGAEHSAVQCAARYTSVVTGRPNPTSAGCYSKTSLKLVEAVFTLDVSTVGVSN